VLLLLKEGLLRVEHVVDVKGIAGLDAVAREDGRLVIGATTTHRALERSPLVRDHCPMLSGVARHVANVRVRNVGTVGGNLAFADPHSDLATVCLALDATVRVASARGERRLALADFVHGAYETARAPDEILTAIDVRWWAADTPMVYLKFGIHERPTLGVALVLALDAAREGVVDARLAVGCVGPRPVRLAPLEQRCRGRSLADLEGAAAEIAAAAPRELDVIADMHGSAEYKQDMVRVFVRRALAIAVARGRGEGSQARYAHTDVV
jgi:aerobic carbon-monoxide dehydrogenase medium subunit